MKLKEYLVSEGLKQGDLAAELDCDPSYISKLCGDRTLPRAVAIRIYRRRGVKLDPIAGFSDDEIAVLERAEGLAA